MNRERHELPTPAEIARARDVLDRLARVRGTGKTFCSCARCLSAGVTYRASADFLQRELELIADEQRRIGTGELRPA